MINSKCPHCGYEQELLGGPYIPAIDGYSWCDVVVCNECGIVYRPKISKNTLENINKSEVASDPDFEYLKAKNISIGLTLEEQHEFMKKLQEHQTTTKS